MLKIFARPGTGIESQAVDDYHHENVNTPVRRKLLSQSCERYPAILGTPNDLTKIRAKDFKFHVKYSSMMKSSMPELGTSEVPKSESRLQKKVENAKVSKDFKEWY
jgi:hypothetical protein